MVATKLSPITATAPPRSAAKSAGKCSLTLTINGVTYAVRPLKPEAFGTIKAFKLTREDGTSYRIGETIEGQRCECGDFKLRRDASSGEACKHIAAARACGLL